MNATVTCPWCCTRQTVAMPAGDHKCSNCKSAFSYNLAGSVVGARLASPESPPLTKGGQGGFASPKSYAEVLNRIASRRAGAVLLAIVLALSTACGSKQDPLMGPDQYEQYIPEPVVQMIITLDGDTLYLPNQ